MHRAKTILCHIFLLEVKAQLDRMSSCGQHEVCDGGMMVRESGGGSMDGDSGTFVQAVTPRVT